MKWKIKVESEVVDIFHVRTEGKAGEVSVPMVIVNFQLKRPIDVQEVKDIVELLVAYTNEFVKPAYNELLVFSGRAPIWLYMALTHRLAHLVGALGVFDPKVGVVIIASHRSNIPEYVVVEIPPDVKAQITQ